MAATALPLLAAACSSSNSASTTSAPASPAGNSGGGSATVKTASVSSVGTVLVDDSGHTLYTYAPDSNGQPHCTGSCASLWPPLTPASGSPVAGGGVHGALATVMRSDGTTQVTIDGKPLYRYSGDSGPGQANGEGVDGVWYVVKAGSSSAGAGATTTSPSRGYGGNY